MRCYSHRYTKILVHRPIHNSKSLCPFSRLNKCVEFMLRFGLDCSQDFFVCLSFIFNIIFDGRRSSVVELRNSNPKTLGSIPWWGRVRNWWVFFLSFQVNSSANLFLCSAHTQKCAHEKDPISICHKRVGITVGGMVTHKIFLNTTKHFSLKCMSLCATGLNRAGLWRQSCDWKSY